MSGRQKHNAKWMAIYNDFVVCYEGGMTMVEIAKRNNVSVSAILLGGCDNAENCDLYVKDAGMWTNPLVESAGMVKEMSVLKYVFDTTAACKCRLP